MARMPAADVEITTDDIRQLLAEQHPDLAHEPITVLANGWDNVMARIGDGLVARLPRREQAAALVHAEQTWLPELAPRLPLPIPVPVRTGVPTPGYPYPWSLTPWLPGSPAVTATGEFTEADSHRVATELAAFLGALHRPAPTQAPRNPFRGVDLPARRPLDERNAASAGASAGFLMELIDRGTAAEPWAHEPVWLHGDLHPANLLITGRGIGAVIDFGDLTAGDPATDLAVAWMLLPAPARARFWAEYAHRAPLSGKSLEIRARAWAAAFALVFLAHSADNPQMAAIGAATAAALGSE
ncbi:aminoglycoside phosphotransferase family protein [Kineosporia succinea]|uniref:Aminoglycoside phosphotransferase (APT) family kinase protein n=1 Tax=Kineosporia succinea TaxID=84632 RepID=A0ABT9PEV4_9ACTN|nr:aminoglycoside phosphotransferase family protein [Kineosporia succinea]MDP9831234.1 aminoglycoside phosphotransferase (APT) family kinase protein [Kineosporia succinea]